MSFHMKQSLLFFVIYVITFLSSSSLTISPLHDPSEVTTVVVSTSNSSSTRKAYSGGLLGYWYHHYNSYDDYRSTGNSTVDIVLYVLLVCAVLVVPFCCYCLYPCCVALCRRGEPEHRFQNFTPQQQQYTPMVGAYPAYPGQPQMVLVQAPVDQVLQEVQNPVVQNHMVQNPVIQNS